MFALAITTLVIFLFMVVFKFIDKEASEGFYILLVFSTFITIITGILQNLDASVPVLIALFFPLIGTCLVVKECYNEEVDQ